MNVKNWKTTVGAAVVFAGAAIAPSAMAAGTGNTVNGCTAKWYATAFAANCKATKQGGYYRNYGSCSQQNDFWTPSAKVSKGATVTGISRGECRFKVQNSKVAYIGN